MIRLYYRCCCINEPVIFNHCVNLKLGHRFHALLKVRSDRDDIVPLTHKSSSGSMQNILSRLQVTFILFETIFPHRGYNTPRSGCIARRYRCQPMVSRLGTIVYWYSLREQGFNLINVSPNRET